VHGVVEIRGEGMMIGIELDRPCAELVAVARDAGVLINVTADNVIRLVPPLIYGAAEVDALVALCPASSRPTCSRRRDAQAFPAIQGSHARRTPVSVRTRARDQGRFKRYQPYHPLVDRTLAMIFEKSSTRTRLSFEAGMHQLGGSAIYLNTRDTQLGRGEPVEDAGEVISRMVDIVMIRTFEQDIIERFASHSRVPVINGLTNEYHPCQILADIFTFIEHRGSIQGKTVAWIGDSNNMCNTWLQAAEVLDFNVHVSTPARLRSRARACEPVRHRPFRSFADPMDACRGADLVTTDVWTSMGFEAENDERMKAFADWQVDADMMGVAKPMPCSCTACRRTAARRSPPR
jgi:ornithine carbamoyltransferase